MGLARESRRYAIAVGVFLILHFGLTVASNAFLGTDRQLTLLPLINAIAYLLYVVAGFVASLGARRYRLLHGVVAGALAAVAAILIFRIAAHDAWGMVALLVTGAFLGGLGGVGSLLLRRGEVHAL